MFKYVCGMLRKIIKVNGIWVYKHHYCKCGCGGRIPFGKYSLIDHNRRGIPEYIQNHHPHGFQKEHKINKGKHNAGVGKNHPAYIDGCNIERASAIHNSLVRGYPYPSFLNEPFKDASPHHIDRETIAFIPRKLHKRIWHQLRNNASMKRINKLVFEYLSVESYRKYVRSYM